MRQLEKALTVRILRRLNAIPGCRAIKRWAGRANPGEVDITGCINGRRFELEVKVPGNEPTPLQLVALKKWARAGAITAVVYSVEEAEEAICSKTQ